ncbi:MAG TPA: DUF5686 and carboxypeptidase regulatory-like domain-containing protein [Chitinophagaceae bacterium]|nr:DUF5686 and carboxypeptidase regulatory-like domain-containing protein [Chitinophagaceae bacterium]
MRRSPLFLCVLLIASSLVSAQTFKVNGRITNNKREPLAFVSIQVKDGNAGTITKEDGTYELELNPGKYDLVVSMVGFLPQVINLIVRNENYVQDIIMEENQSVGLAEVIIRTKLRDRSEEYINNVIRHKDSLLDASGPYSVKVYIRATQEDSFHISKKNKEADTTLPWNNEELSRMSMAEILLRYDQQSAQKSREERLAVTKRGNVDGLFYLSTTEGDLNIYNNLIKIPGISQVPFVSPVSYSGLLAYRFKTIRTERIGKRRIYTISVKPRQLSNATVEGEIMIADSSWVVLHAQFTLPSYHLPEYDYFEVEQDYRFVDSTAWMIDKQTFSYYTKVGKGKKSGQTVVTYNDFELNKQFEKKHFGTELSSTAQQAYEKDSLFWQTYRPAPLSDRELRFIKYKDSLFRATHTRQYLDSIDRVINKVTWGKILFAGQTFNNHDKERRWYLPPATTLYQPLEFGGGRLNLSFAYFKTSKSRKNVSLTTEVSYGFRNHDVNGVIQIKRLYNPFNRGVYNFSIGRRFENIVAGDAWINNLKRSNTYLNNFIDGGHEVELLNGLFLFTEFQLSLRRSVANYKVNPKIDTLFGNTQPVPFEPYNAFYGKFKLEYSPWQRYIREPKEKIIIGSRYPTFFVSMTRGFPRMGGSKVNFSFLEVGMKQTIRLGLIGMSKYSIMTGGFTKQEDLRVVDYKYFPKGDPLWFQNPEITFQALDSTFPLFRRFYEGHFVHEFNGLLINKIPLVKKLKLREIIGAAFLVSREKDLHYVEFFAGLERIIKSPFDPLGKYKIGVYIVRSSANKFLNPIQFKVGFTMWDKVKNKWK